MFIICFVCLCFVLKLVEGDIFGAGDIQKFIL